LIFIVQSVLFEYIVDNFMLSNYYTLRYVVSTLASVLVGKSIGELFSQEKGVAVLTSPDTDEALVLSCRSDVNTLYLQPHFSRAKANSANILSTALGQSISSVSIVGADRTVCLPLSSGDSLYAQFYGPRANIFLVNPGGIITTSFKNGRRLNGTPFTEPDCRLPGHTIEDLKDRLGSETAGPALKRLYPTLGPILVTEVLFRAGIRHTAPVGNADEIHALHDALHEVLAGIGRPAPRIYLSDTPLFSLIPLRQFGDRKFKAFDDVNDAIRTFIHLRMSSERNHDERKLIATTIEKTVERASRTVAAMQNDLQNSTRADDYQSAGTLLLSSLQEIPGGSSTWTFHDGAETREVRLDPRRTPAQNARLYFDKAKQTRAMQLQAQQRLASLEQTIARGRTLLASLAHTNSRDELKALMKEHSDELHAFGISERGKKEELPPFRVFTVDGGFRVLAGKSSANNDLLTMKYAKQNDLWFHARGSSGSHVVLRVGQGTPSKKAKEQAAAIAAYYSKMRNAKHVPVAMTERKYVHKPKGAPPGTVVLDRETVLYAEPGLPKDA
jgi:predicted ribosome quality control (RQC) complex YloA/Tae2 family protein